MIFMSCAHGFGYVDLNQQADMFRIHDAELSSLQPPQLALVYSIACSGCWVQIDAAQLSGGSKGSPEIVVASMPGTKLLDRDFLELTGELEIEGTVFFSIAVPPNSRHFDFDLTIAPVRLM